MTGVWPPPVIYGLQSWGRHFGQGHLWALGTASFARPLPPIAAPSPRGARSRRARKLMRVQAGIPSQYPGSILWKISSPDSVAASGPTLKTRMYWRGEGAVWFPISAIYSRVSFSEKASPLGPSKSLATILISPAVRAVAAVVPTPVEGSGRPAGGRISGLERGRGGVRLAGQNLVIITSGGCRACDRRSGGTAATVRARRLG